MHHNLHEIGCEQTAEAVRIVWTYFYRAGSLGGQPDVKFWTT